MVSKLISGGLGLDPKKGTEPSPKNTRAAKMFVGKRHACRRLKLLQMGIKGSLVEFPYSYWDTTTRETTTMWHKDSQPRNVPREILTTAVTSFPLKGVPVALTASFTKRSMRVTDQNMPQTGSLPSPEATQSWPTLSRKPWMICVLIFGSRAKMQDTMTQAWFLCHPRRVKHAQRKTAESDLKAGSGRVIPA